MKTCKEYRVEGKQALSGQWGMAILAMLIYGVLIGVCSMTCGIALLICGGAFTCGYAYTWMSAIRGNKIQLSELFEGFSKPSFSATIGVNVKTAIFIWLWSLLFCIPGIVKMFAYSMAPYILMDHPELTGGEAITRSKELMKGKKGKLFLLQLSFIGWDILSCFTLGILQFWIAPWKQAATAAFYQSICDEYVSTETVGE